MNSSKGGKYFLLITFFFAFGTTTISAKDDSLELRILTIPIINETQKEQLDPICGFIGDQINRILNIIGNYELYHMEKSLDPPSMGDVKSFVEKNSVDKVIYGFLKPSDDNTTLFDINVYDVTEGGISINKTETIVSVFDVFDVMDQTVTSMLESLTGMHIGYGGLSLKNTGEDGAFKVRLNNTELGKNEYNYDHILNGDYKLEIMQTRFGGKVAIFSDTIRIVENETINLEFNIPYLMDAEKSNIENLLSAFEQRKQGRIELSAAQNSADTLNTLFKDLSFCEGLKGYKKEIEQGIFQWKLFEEQLALIETYEKGEPGPFKVTPELSDSFDTNSRAKSENYDFAIFLNRARAFDYFKNNDRDKGIETYLGSDKYLAGISAGFRDTFLSEYNYFKDVNTELSVARENRPGNFWPWTSIITGLFWGGASTYEFIDNPVPALLGKADALYPEYEATTDPSEAERLHKTIEWNYILANALEYIKWGGTVAAPTLTGLGTWGLISHKRFGIAAFKDRLALLLEDYIYLKDELQQLHTPGEKVEFVSSEIEEFVSADNGDLPVIDELPETKTVKTEPVVVNASKKKEFDHFMWSLSVGGGSIVTAGLLWKPWRWLGIQTGIAGTYETYGMYGYKYFIISNPVEIDLFIMQKPFPIYIGATTDLIRYGWHFTGNIQGYIPDFGWTLGLNFGAGIPIGNITISINNYIYSIKHTVSYSSSIGILF